MFDLQRVINNLFLEKSVATGYEITDEGSCLVRIIENGVEKVKNSDGVAGEHFCGFSIISNKTPVAIAKVETFTVPATAPYVITLVGNNVLANELRIQDTTRGLDTSYGTLTIITTGSPGPTQALASYRNGTVTFNAARAGDTIVAYYRYDLTVRASMQMLTQRISRYNVDPTVYNQIGIYAGMGIIYTDQYDNTKDYNNVAYGQLKTGANGLITVGGNGVPVGAVIATPASDYPYLGVSYSIQNM